MASTDVKKIIARTFEELASSLETGKAAPDVTVALTALGSEHGEDLLYEAACQAAEKGINVRVIGSKPCEHPNVTVTQVESEEAGHKSLEMLLDSKEADAGVTMHYPFPIGVTTIGRVITPARGKEMYIAATTGTSSAERAEALVRNAICGIAAAKACGVKRPSVGILNLDGARAAERALKKLRDSGYDIEFAESERSDGGAVMRGNDLLTGSCDVMVADSLTGNVLMKIFSAFHTGGSYESLGFGYGPGLGDGFDKIILIISRASGVPVVRGAIEFAAELSRGGVIGVFEAEMRAAKAAGLDGILADLKPSAAKEEKVEAPAKEVVTEEIHGIEILELENAVTALWSVGIYAESGMGCTGPVVLISAAKLKKAKELLAQKGYISG